MVKHREIYYCNCFCFRHTIPCLEGGLQFPENKYTQICNHLEEKVTMYSEAIIK